jgi:hypothetical protein
MIESNHVRAWARAALRGPLRRSVSYAQLLRPDTPQVPETRGVQCCLDHAVLAGPSGFLGVTATLFPFFPHVMTSFP